MKATKITIHYEDGSMDVANGDAAAQIIAWWSTGEWMAYIHGARYTGPQLTHVTFIDVAPEEAHTSHGMIVHDGGKPDGGIIQVEV